MQEVRRRYRFAISDTLGNWTFSTASSNADTVNDEPLFGFVAETTCFVGTGGTGCTMDDVELAVFPASYAEEKTEDIGLLVLVQLYSKSACRFTQRGKSKRIIEFNKDWDVYLRDTCRHPFLSNFTP